MRAPPRVYGMFAAMLAVTCSASIGRADDTVVAQALFDQGKKAMAAHDFAAACPKFEESLRLESATGTLLNLADCYERAGRLASAWSRFLEVASKAHAAGQAERARIGRNRAAALAPRLSNLVIQAPAVDRPPGLEIRRDGSIVGPAELGATIPADPGPHTVEASAPGRLSWSTTVDVGDHAATATVVVPELAPVPPEPTAAEPAPPSTSGSRLVPSTTVSPEGDRPRHGGRAQKVLAIVSGGIGVAGIGVGTYFGLTSISKHNLASGECGATTCATHQGVTDSNDARTTGNISTAAFIVGAAGVAGGLVLWFTAPTSETSSMALGFGPATIQMRGTW
jgi:hypothetical protein